MTFDWHICCLDQSNGVRFTTAIQISSLQDIISTPYSGEIFLVTPGKALAWMAALHPVFKFTEDPIVHVIENLLTDCGAVE